MNVTDEILLEDSDDDFIPSKLVRRRSSTRLRSSVSRLGVDQKQNSAEDANLKPKTKTGGTKHVENKINEEKDKDQFKNALKEKLTAARTNVIKNSTPPLKRKLSEGWKQAQLKLTPMKSNKRFSTLDDDYDFKDETPKSKKSRIQPTEGSSSKVSKLTRSLTKSTGFSSTKSTLNESVKSTRSEESNSSFISLDDDEVDLEVELAKIDKLKQSLDRQSQKPVNRTPFTKKISNTATSQPVKINFSNSSVKKNPSLGPKLQRSTATSTPANKQKTFRKEKVASVPKVIETGPIDIFDDLIVKTNRGYPCNFCDKNLMFSKRREMINHLQLEHEEELTNPQKDRELAGVFTCEVCDSTFHSKHILRIHTKGHQKISVTQKCDNYYKYYLNIRVF